MDVPEKKMDVPALKKIAEFSIGKGGKSISFCRSIGGHKVKDHKHNACLDLNVFHTYPSSFTNIHHYHNCNFFPKLYEKGVGRQEKKAAYHPCGHTSAGMFLGTESHDALRCLPT